MRFSQIVISLLRTRIREIVKTGTNYQFCSCNFEVVCCPLVPISCLKNTFEFEQLPRASFYTFGLRYSKKFSRDVPYNIVLRLRQQCWNQSLLNFILCRENTMYCKIFFVVQEFVRFYCIPNHKFVHCNKVTRCELKVKCHQLFKLVWIASVCSNSNSLICA